jgi:hypothetical protein
MGIVKNQWIDDHFLPDMVANPDHLLGQTQSVAAPAPTQQVEQSSSQTPVAQQQG